MIVCGHGGVLLSGGLHHACQEWGRPDRHDTTTNRPITFNTLDNLGEVTQVSLYDGDGVTINTVNGVPQPPASSLLQSQTDYRYDDQGRVFASAICDPDGTLVTSTASFYDANGDVIETVDGDSNYTTSTYDGAGRLIASASYTYDAGRNTLTSSSSNAYDGDGNLTQTTDGDGNYTGDSYDGIGRLLSTASYTYNAGSHTYTLASSSSTLYDDAANSIRTTDGDGNYTIDSYDPLGQLLNSASYNAGSNTLVSSTRYVYDGDGNVVRTTDGMGNYMVYTYDLLDQLSSSHLQRGQNAGQQHVLHPRPGRRPASDHGWRRQLHRQHLRRTRKPPDNGDL